jgi:hypothetical protein
MMRFAGRKVDPQNTLLLTRRERTVMRGRALERLQERESPGRVAAGAFLSPGAQTLTGPAWLSASRVKT